MGYQAQWQEWLNEAYELLEKLRKHEKLKGWQLEVRILDKKLKKETLIQEAFRKGKEKIIIYDRCYVENESLAFYPEIIYISSKEDKLVPLRKLASIFLQ